MNLEAPPFTDKQQYQKPTAWIHHGKAGTGNGDGYWEAVPLPWKGEEGARCKTRPCFQ